ncbi:unnamed protein product, partial [Staurois parvus]
KSQGACSPGAPDGGDGLGAPETRSWLLGASSSVVVVCAKGSHGEESDVRRSEDPTARDGWMDRVWSGHTPGWSATAGQNPIWGIQERGQAKQGSE